MAKKESVKSIEIELSLNGSKVTQTLETIDKRVKSSKKELTQIKQALASNWDSKKFQRAQELASQSVEDTAAKVKALKKEYEATQKAAKDSADGQKDKLNDLSKELAYAENAARKAREELAQLEKMRFDQWAASFKDAAGNLDKIGSSMTRYVTAPIIAAGVASVKMGSNTQEAINKVEISFGSCADSIKKWSENTLDAYGISRTTALDMAAYFGDMSTSMGFTQQQAAQMSKEIVGWIGDIASFKNISIDTAKTVASAIWTGETESAKKIGVVMTEANLQAYLASQGVEALYKNMSQLEKVQVRYNYVMHSTANAQGDFANTSSSTANQTRILTESVKELAATFGESIAPVVTPLITNLTEITKRFAGMDEQTRKFIVQLAIAAATLGPLLKITGNLTNVIGTLITLYPVLTAKLHAKQVADVGATTTQTALNAAMNANPVMMVVSAIGMLISVLGSLVIAQSLAAGSTENLTNKVKANKDAYDQSVESIEKSADEKIVELNAIEKLLPKIEELNNKTNRNAAEQKALNDLVEKVNAIYPNLIGNINSQTGSYNLNTAAIKNNIAALKEQVRMEAQRDLAVEKYKRVAQIDDDLSKLKEEYNNLYADYKDYASSDVNLYIDTMLDMFGASKYKDLERRSQQIRELQKEKEKLEKEIDGLLDFSEIDEKTENLFDLTDIKPKDDKSTASKTDKTNELKRRLQDYINEYKSFVDDVVKLAENAANKKIEAINKEIEARDKLLERQNAEKRLAQAQAKLKYELDNGNREELKKEIDRLKKEAAEKQYKEAMQSQKDAINAEIAALRANAETIVAQYAKTVDPKNLTGQNGYSNTTLNSNISFAQTGLTPAQTEALIKRVFNDLIRQV